MNIAGLILQKQLHDLFGCGYVFLHINRKCRFGSRCNIRFSGAIVVG